MEIVGYCRVSTEEQATHGVSLDDQADRITAHCTERGWTLAAIHTDAGISGSVPFAQRPAGAQAITSGLPILVTAWDRLSRDAADFLALVRDRECHSITEEGEPPLLRDLRAVLNEEERRKIRERTRAAAAKLHRDGRYNGPPVYGYTFTASQLVPCEHEAAIVRRIFAEFTGGRNLSQIARSLNAEQIPTKRGGKWRQGTIGALVRNPVYAGRVRMGTEEREGTHDAILDEATFAAAQELAGAISTRQGAGRGRPPKLAHLFTGGTLRCGECGESMVPRSGKLQGGSPHYLCAGRQNLGCTMPYADRALIDSAVYAYFELVGLDVEATRQAIEEARDRKLAEVRSLLAEAERESARVADRLARIRRDYTEGHLDVADWQSFRAELEADQAAATAEADRLRAAEQDAEGWAAGRDAEREALRQLAAIRAAIVGEVREAEGVDAVRAALARMFERFVLHRKDSPSAPTQLHAELAMGAPGYLIEPVIRPEAIEHLSPETAAPILRREPLGDSGNKQRQGVPQHCLLSPIEVGPWPPSSTTA